MSRTSNRKLGNWITFEAQAASGARPEATGIEQASMEARVGRANYRLAEALLQSGSQKDFIQEVRTKIGRGFIREAEEMLAALLAGDALIERALSIDLQTELARVHYQRAEWAASIEAVNRALYGDDVPGIARLTFLQIRSAAWFELGEWEKCLADVESIGALQLLYPDAQGAFYAEVLAVKALARKSESSAASENRYLELLERVLVRRPRLNADTLLTLLRLRIDLRRVVHGPTAELALASHRLAEAMGDRLYAALAVVELRYGESSSLREEAIARLPELRKNFDKVDRLLAEAERAQPVSTTARTLRESAVAPLFDARTLEGVKPRGLVALGPAGDYDLRVDLETLDVSPLAKTLQEKSRLILLALAEGALSREELFRRVWKLRFDPERHDGILRNALLRVRKQAGCAVVSEDGFVALADVEIVRF